eukprot:11501875-Alexandrium_andersonii.AAC.1
MPSSTRAEIFGLVTAGFADGPARVGIDNSNVVRRAQGVIRGRGAFPQPWGISRDGDAWSIIEALVAARGRGSIAVEKVKAHATMEHVGTGVTD